MNKHTIEIVKNWNFLEQHGLNRHVFVDWSQVDCQADGLSQNLFEGYEWRGAVYAKHDLAFAAQQIFANCFNAHFNVFENPDTKYAVANPNDSARPFTGALALQSVMYRYLGETIPHSNDFEKYVKSPRMMAKFFGGIIPIPSPELKQKCGKDFIENLESRYQGNPLNLLEEATVFDPLSGKKVLRAFNDGRGLVELLADQFGEAYRDKCAGLFSRNGEPESLLSFNFLKRAQLVTVLIHGRALSSGGMLPLIADIEEVGPIADYEVPKVPRHLKMVKYSGELAELVDNWKEIPEGSQMEIEIRASMVAVFVRLLELLNSERIERKLPAINISHLDLWGWLMGKNLKHLRPHLTRTSAY